MLTLSTSLDIVGGLQKGWRVRKRNILFSSYAYFTLYFPYPSLAPLPLRHIPETTLRSVDDSGCDRNIILILLPFSFPPAQWMVIIKDYAEGVTRLLLENLLLCKINPASTIINACKI